MLPALTVGRLDAKVRLQKWEKVGEIRRGPHDRAANETGRILIPSELRQMCGLDREVALIGMGEHFELWDRSTLEAREREALAAELDAADFSF